MKPTSRTLLVTLLAATLAACGGGAASPSVASNSGAAAASKPVGAAAASSGAAGTGGRITVPYTAFAGAFAALWVAADEGFFERQGIPANVQYMDPNVAVNALMSGEVEFSSSGAAVNSIVSGSDIILVARLITTPLFSLYGTKDIQRVEDLKGKVIADNQAGSAPDNALRDILAKHGLTSTDVQLAYSPNPTAALATLVAGRASAVIVPPPTTVQARNAGFKELTDTATEGIPGIASTISTKKALARERPDRVRAFLQALSDATAYMKSNPAQTKQIIGKYSKDDNPADLDETYKAYLPQWKVSSVTVEDVAAVLRYSSDPKATSADPKTFFDDSIVNSLH